MKERLRRRKVTMAKVEGNGSTSMEDGNGVARAPHSTSEREEFVCRTLGRPTTAPYHPSSYSRTPTRRGEEKRVVLIKLLKKGNLRPFNPVGGEGDGQALWVREVGSGEVERRGGEWRGRRRPTLVMT